MSDAVVLLSGGLDSATVLAVARDRGRACHAVTFDYGQRHACELRAAAAVSEALGAASHRVIAVDTSVFARSALVDASIPVPDGGDITQGIPTTYVPARNLLFLSYAVAIAESTGAREAYIGANAIDYSGYPDCRREFLDAFARASALGTKAGVEGSPIAVEAPLLDMSKAEIIRLGARLGVDFALTHSCYDPADDGFACGRCDACRLRRRGFLDAGVHDPTRYRADAPR